MVLLESVQIELGTKMPEFQLNDSNSTPHSTQSEIGKKGLLIVFTCNHCPYAQAVWERVIKIAAQAKKLGINTVAINPNINPDYPEDSPERMKKLIKTLDIKFPYLVDEVQQTARDFKAQCTPDIYLVNAKNELAYHGRIDDNWQDEHTVKNHELLAAINALANGLPQAEKQYPSTGCSIKWVD